ncbi:Gti1/Pac2 family-domain-containing protein [Lentinula raphanica]|uniref:Gti1/Pac2 family-domain-containing protein n=1 Tax=Lentinula raphanica TaxID=153919 RepID=A0AA38UAQ5_9AGAR|nr:Gti1/Pac2 family-domain-containing protein [Lentinula raphanica]KAJ3824553.1 Gti1/Pac2 family-domain-containing protein [Lentinula raphanica]KAJ3835125.1 Gti1/Pac2 family-domain-containing protein [Lentinula raphanica]KAJ3975140.1 Gti1/Pac2 family-domain-containing protein [Lentinula raphanica]
MSFSNKLAAMYPNSIDSEVFVTHPSLHIRDAQDAHVVLEAVRLRILPLIKRRLVASERDSLSTGNVFVWEEAEDEGGLLRWTDGRRWSQSRMRGDYLFYEEKVETTVAEKEAKAARRARRASDPSAIIPPPIRRKDRPTKPDGLTKQTYSALVHLPGTNETRKWHVVAYFSGNDYTRLPVIENYDYLRRIRVPEGVFVNSKSLTKMDLPDSPLVEAKEHEQRRFVEGYPLRPISPTRPLYPPAFPPPLSPPMLSEPHQRVSLPPISTLDYPQRPGFLRHSSASSAQETQYTPLSTEDQRALRRLRINL